MFSMCSELTPRGRIPDTRIPQLMQPCHYHHHPHHHGGHRVKRVRGSRDGKNAQILHTFVQIFGGCCFVYASTLISGVLGWF